MVPEANVKAVWTFRVKVPELHAPFPCVEPSENIVSPSFPASTRVIIELVEVALDNPEMVTTEPSEDARFASATSVTVIMFAPPARGLL